MASILIVEDDRFFREFFSNLLVAEGYQVDCASCGSDGLDMIASGQYSLVITDLVMPDVNGLEILSHVRESHPSIDVIMVTGNANLESAIFALKHGARDYLVKPVNPDEFKHSVSQCVLQRRLLDENEELRNMLSLFRASQAIAGCLDREHLYQLLVEAIIREVDCAAAMGFFVVSGELSLKYAKSISTESGDLLISDLAKRLTTFVDETPVVSEYMLPPQFTADGYCGAWLIPVRNSNSTLGIILLFDRHGQPSFDSKAHTKNIHFLVEQSLGAFENSENYTQAKDQLFIDDVSGLYNHRYLDVALEREMKRVERYASHLAVLFIDVDAFKQVNDTYGHMVGSRVLAEFGALLKKSVRDVDIVIRYGGDEYTVILVETSCSTAAIVAERIRRNVETHDFSGNSGTIVKLTCSIGYACCPDDTASKDSLLEMADAAMYAGKSSGKNCVIRIADKGLQK